jgi:hypothetical protein
MPRSDSSSSSSSISSNFSGAKKTRSTSKPKTRTKTKTKTIAKGGHGQLGGVGKDLAVFESKSHPKTIVGIELFPLNVSTTDTKSNPHHISPPNRPLQWDPRYVPLELLHDRKYIDYAAGLSLLYHVMFNHPDHHTQDVVKGCEVFRESDSVDVLEKEICTLLHPLLISRKMLIHGSRPLDFKFPLHEHVMIEPLKAYFYGSDSSQLLLDWKYSMDNRSFGETNSQTVSSGRDTKTEDEKKKEQTTRDLYKEFLKIMYLFMAMAKLSIHRAVAEEIRIQYAERINYMSVAVLEARILNIAAQLQLGQGKYVRTPKEWEKYTKNIEIHRLMHPVITNLVGQYYYLGLSV